MTLLIPLFVDNWTVCNLPNDIVLFPKRASAKRDERRNKKNSREKSVPIGQDLQISSVKGTIVRYRVLWLQTRQTKAARSVFPSENAQRSPWAINLRFLRHIEDRSCSPMLRLCQYCQPRPALESMGAPLIAIKMGLEESLPSYCFSSSVVNGSSFGGAMSFRGACMMLSSGFFESRLVEMNVISIGWSAIAGVGFRFPIGWMCLFLSSSFVTRRQ